MAQPLPAARPSRATGAGSRSSRMTQAGLRSNGRSDRGNSPRRLGAEKRTWSGWVRTWRISGNGISSCFSSRLSRSPSSVT